MIQGTIWFWFGLMLFTAPDSNSKEQLFGKAMQHLQKKEDGKALALFKKLLPMFQQEQKTQKKQSRLWSQMQIAKCNILYQIAHLSWKAGNKRASCLARQDLEQQRKGIPQKWLKFVGPTLPKQFTSSQKQLQTTCQSVTTQIQLQLTPKTTKVFVKSGKQWKEHKGRVIETKEKSVTLKLQAPGFKEATLTSPTLKRWLPNTLTKSLQVLPKKQPATRKNPERRRMVIVVVPPKKRKKAKGAPIYKKWWFWTGIGIVVAGGAAAAIVATTPTNPEFKNKDKTFQLW